MTIVFSCPDCLQAFKVADEKVGRKAKCSNCGRELFVPLDSDEVAVAELAAKYPSEILEESTEHQPVLDDLPPITPPPVPEASEPPISSPLINKPCPFCAETIKAAARKCRYCGEMLDESLRQQESDQSIILNAPNLGVAVILSILIPGAGSMYAGKVGRGIWLLILTVFGYMLLVFPGLILHVFTLMFAYEDAKHFGEKGPRY